jgi:hypothetical protein
MKHLDKRRAASKIIIVIFFQPLYTFMGVVLVHRKIETRLECGQLLPTKRQNTVTGAMLL